jgi:hypothetical protein
MSAFGECNDLERWINLPVSNLKGLLDMVGASKAEVAAAIEPWMHYEPDYVLGH